jgi:hypothetical protein
MIAPSGPFSTLRSVYEPISRFTLWGISLFRAMLLEKMTFTLFQSRVADRILHTCDICRAIGMARRCRKVVVPQMAKSSSFRNSGGKMALPSGGRLCCHNLVLYWFRCCGAAAGFHYLLRTAEP